MPHYPGAKVARSSHTLRLSERSSATRPPIWINTGIMNAGIDLYPLFLARGLVRSKREFSRDWCGAAPNYLCLRGDRQLPDHIILRILRRLIRERRFVLAAYVARELLWPEAPPGFLRRGR